MKTTPTTMPTFSVDPQTFIDGFQKSFASFNDVAAEGKRNVEALTTSFSVAAKGAETLGAETMAYAKSAYEGATAHAKALTGAKTPQDVIELQTAFAKTMLDSYVAQLNKGFDLVSSTMTASTAPLAERTKAMTAQFQTA